MSKPVIDLLKEGGFRSARDEARSRNLRVSTSIDSLLANGVESEWEDQPDGLALYRSFHLLAAKQLYVLAELLPIEFNQTTPVDSSIRIESNTEADAAKS